MASIDYDEALGLFRDLFPNVVLTDWFLNRRDSIFSFRPWMQNLFDREFVLNVITDLPNLTAPIRMSPARLLLEAGIALTPASTVGDLRAGYAVVRYGWYFRNLVNGSSLLLPPECSKLEQRQKTMMSEELGLGIACYVMREIFNQTHIGDVLSAIDHKLVRKKPKARKHPDFCALDSNSCLSFTESKGTTVSPAKMRREAANGKNQLEAVEPSNLPGSKNNYVVSTYFATQTQVGGAGESEVLIADPDASSFGSNAGEDADQLVRCAYAKVCRYADQDELANRLLLRKNWVIGREVNLDGSGYLPLGFDPFGNVVLLDKRVFQRLANNATLNLHTDADKFEPASERDKLNLLPNGVALVSPSFRF